MNLNYAAPWGVRTRRMTLFSVSIILIFPLFAWWQTPASEPLSLRIVLLLIPVVLLGGTYLFSVRSYSLTEQAVLINRLIGPVRLPTAEIEAIEKMPYATDLSIRVMGNGGMFGFNGRFRNNILGPYRAHVTDPANCVVLRLKNKNPIVISPENPGRFVAAVEKRRAGH